MLNLDPSGHRSPITAQQSPTDADGKTAAEAVCSGQIGAERKLLLTPTGLLMEGDVTGTPFPFDRAPLEWIGGKLIAALKEVRQ